MRKNAFLLILSAMAVMTGCRMEEEAPEMKKNGPEIRFVARTDALTRTVFGEPEGTTYPTYWTGNETVGISLNYEWAEEVDITVNESRTAAEFNYVPEALASSYTFFVVTPASALEKPSKSRKALRIAVPAVQKPLPGSVDEGAQVFYANTSTFKEKPTSVDVRFNHLTAYGKLTLKNVTGTPVRLTLISDQALSGSCYVALDGGAVSTRDGAHTLTIDLENLAVSGGNLNDIWFACLPANLAGTPLTVEGREHLQADHPATGRSDELRFRADRPFLGEHGGGRGDSDSRRTGRVELRSLRSLHSGEPADLRRRVGPAVPRI